MNILVVAAHPDDEILGVGGTIAKHIEKGDKVWALILGEGQVSRFAKPEHGIEIDEILQELRKDTITSAGIIGFEEVFFEQISDNRFDSVDLLDIVKIVESYVRKIEPAVIYTHHGGDMNIDHQLTYKAVLTATRPMAGCPVKTIYAFETVSSTEWNFAYGDEAFTPNVFVHLTKEQLQRKLDAMAAYRSELCEFPHPRSLKMLEAVATRWGGVCGAPYAEAFELVRDVR